MQILADKRLNIKPVVAGLSREAKELIDELREDGSDDQQILYFLEDGESLYKAGYTDEDQDIIEEAHDFLEKKLRRKNQRK